MIASSSSWFRTREGLSPNRWSPIGECGRLGPAADLLGEGPEPGPVAVGAGLAPAGHAHHDQAGIRGAELVVAEVPALERAGPEVLDEDVGVGGELPQDQLSLGGLQ